MRRLCVGRKQIAKSLNRQLRICPHHTPERACWSCPSLFQNTRTCTRAFPTSLCGIQKLLIHQECAWCPTKDGRLETHWIGTLFSRIATVHKSIAYILCTSRCSISTSINTAKRWIQALWLLRTKQTRTYSPSTGTWHHHHGHMASILDGQREETHGSGHLWSNFVGVASVREGRGMLPRGIPTLAHLV